MENKNMIINTKLSIIDYLQVVNDIVLEYFNIDGSYQPHIGMLNAMRVFYNVCVKESEFDNENGHEIIDVLELEDILGNEEFMHLFNNAIVAGEVKLDFANAYKQALEIVDAKKTSLGNSIEIISNMISKFLNSLDDLFNDESINRISDIAEKMSNGKINADTIVEAYTQSQRFKDVVNSEHND